MKMSKSIKDYRDAMDNIRISDSFYKRTETLLNDLPEIQIEKRPAITPSRITAFVTAAAACLLLIFGVRFLTGRGGEENIELTEAITEVTEISEETATASAPPLVDDLDGGGDFFDEEFEEDFDDDVADDLDVGVSPDGGEPSAIDPAYDPPVKETASARSAPVKTTDPKASEGGAGTAADTPKNAVTIAGTEPIAEAEEVPLLRDISYENVTVEITPYFDMGNIKSGENPVKMAGTDCSNIVEFIAGITDTGREIGNYSFTSLFSLRIADDNIGLTFYSIYVTDLNAVVVTKHGTDGQKRTTYIATPADYEALKHILFLQFGSEEDYELFTSLISGK